MHRPDAPTREDARPGEPAGAERALLVTDVVDSTRLTEMLGNAEAARLFSLRITGPTCRPARACSGTARLCRARW